MFMPPGSGSDTTTFIEVQLHIPRSYWPSRFAMFEFSSLTKTRWVFSETTVHEREEKNRFLYLFLKGQSGLDLVLLLHFMVQKETGSLRISSRSEGFDQTDIVG
jgi:hypothetical protein